MLINLLNKSLFLFLTLILFNPIASSQPIWIDDFDGSNSTNTPQLSGPLCNGNVNGADGYWGIMCDVGVGCGNEIPTILSDNYGPLPNQFLGAFNSDLDSICGPQDGGQETIEWFGIDASSCTNSSDELFLCLDMAKAANYNYIDFSGNPITPGGWDGPSRVRLIVWIDNNPYALATWEETGGINSGAGLDTNCDGTGDIIIPNTLTTFCFRMVSGNSIDVLIEIDGLNEPSEDIAIDNVAIYCNNPIGTVYDVDFDCDGILGHLDCNDILPFVTSSNVNDADCDGVPTGEDCDDSDSNNTASCCPDTLDIAGIIPTDLYQASNFIISDGHVISGSNGDVIFNAGNYIHLGPGFETDATYQFTAEIINCLNNPGP